MLSRKMSNPKTKARWTVTTGLVLAGTPAPLAPRLWPGRKSPDTGGVGGHGWPPPPQGGRVLFPSVDAQGPGSMGTVRLIQNMCKMSFLQAKLKDTRLA